MNDDGDEPDGAPVSTELKHELRIWAGYYREHYDKLAGEWIPADSVLAYNRLGRRLGNRVAAELGPRFRVMLDVHDSPVDVCGWEEIPGVWPPKPHPGRH